MIQGYIISAVLGSAIASGAVWKVQEWRYSAQIDRIKTAYAVEVADAVSQARADEARYFKQVQEAEREAAEEAIRNERIVERTRTESDRLRGDLEALRRRVPDLTRVTVVERVTTLTDVFGECVARYQDLARKADRHVADIRKLKAAWPVSEEEP